VLLDYARDLIGAGVTAKRHQVVLKDLRVACSLRKSALERAEIAGAKMGKGPPVAAAKDKDKSLKTMTVAELGAAAAKEKGEHLKAVLTELGTRKGDQVIATLGIIAGKDDKDTAQLAKTLLVEQLSNVSGPELKTWLKSGPAAVRAAAAQVIGNKGYRYIDELIAALGDADEGVRQAARAALVKFAESLVDHGPVVGASPKEREQAAQRWRMYWQKKQ
jgi:HEAT repeats